MESEKQKNNTPHPSDTRPWLYKKGQSGNPNGRPKGSKTLKTYLRERFERMTDDEREEFLEGIDKKTIWEMTEGSAKNTVDIESGGKPLQFAVISYAQSTQVPTDVPQEESNKESGVE